MHANLMMKMFASASLICSLFVIHSKDLRNFERVNFIFSIQLNTVRELSIMSVKSHPAAMHIIPDMSDEHKYQKSTIQSSLLFQQPSR